MNVSGEEESFGKASENVVKKEIAFHPME